MSSRLGRFTAALPWPWARWRHRELDRRLGELRWYVQTLADQLERVGTTLDAARHAAEEARSISANLRDTLHRELALQGNQIQGVVQQVTDRTGALHDDLTRAVADVTAQLHAVQVNQVALQQPGAPTLRLALSSQVALPLHRLADGALSFASTTSDHPTRVAVVSVPKAGTYLMAEVLTTLGWVNTHVHAWALGLHDYRDLTIRQIITDYVAHQVSLPIDASAPLVRPGQFWVGHFEVDHCRHALADFLKVFMIRDLRVALVSYMRWLSNPGRGGRPADAWRHLPDTETKFLPFFESHGRQYLRWCGDIVGWLDVPDVCVVRFEEVTRAGSESAAPVSSLAEILGLPVTAVAQAIRLSLGRETKTYSGRYSSLEDVWSPRIEELFRAAGGPELNARLGYPADAPTIA